MRISFLFLVVVFFSLAASAEAQLNPDLKLCSELSEKERRVTERCKTEEERREDEQKKRQEALAEKEKPTKNSFLKYIHVDGVYTQSSWGGDALGLYGLVGAHLCIIEMGRVQIFGPPGVLIMRDTASSGSSIALGLSWGVSLRLFETNIPGMKHRVRVFGNIIKVWGIGGNYATSVSPRSGVDMMGISITPFTGKGN
jgi:hypothetical protein